MKILISCTAALAVLIAAAFVKTPDQSPEGMARKIDAILDRETPLEITEDDLVNKWPKEIAPYFEYEFLTNGEAKVPKVSFFESTDAFQCFHVYGYTFVFDQSGSIFLNQRFINPISPSYRKVSALTTLVHETAHIQGGDFAGMDSEASEKNTQLATLEVLAAMANSDNKYARQALLGELRDIYVGVVLSRALKSGEMHAYTRLLKDLYGNSKERGLRKWRQIGLGKLEEILSAYSVSVYDDFQDFQFTAKAEGDKSPRTLLMDDLKAFLENL